MQFAHLSVQPGAAKLRVHVRGATLDDLARQLEALAMSLAAFEPIAHRSANTLISDTDGTTH
jgi:hypothetical protein